MTKRHNTTTERYWVCPCHDWLPALHSKIKSPNQKTVKKSLIKCKKMQSEWRLISEPVMSTLCCENGLFILRWPAAQFPKCPSAPRPRWAAVRQQLAVDVRSFWEAERRAGSYEPSADSLRGSRRLVINRGRLYPASIKRCEHITSPWFSLDFRIGQLFSASFVWRHCCEVPR